jgi:hypothetical protein
MEAAVVGRGGEAGKRPSVEPERRQSIAEAFFRAWRRGFDVLSQLLERCALVGRQPSQIAIDIGPRLWSRPFGSA